jgi:hypothetical protein
MGKVYQTAMGKNIDMARLATKNEHVRAVGNMNVNTRGDIIDSNNNIIQDASKRVNSMYRKLAVNVDAQPKVTDLAANNVQHVTEMSEIEKNLLEEFDEPNPVKEEVKKESKSTKKR